jgi:hypothetical protein
LIGTGSVADRCKRGNQNMSALYENDYCAIYRS